MEAGKRVVLFGFFGKFPREVDLLKIFDIINIRDGFYRFRKRKYHHYNT